MNVEVVHLCDAGHLGDDGQVVNDERHCVLLVPDQVLSVA